MKFTHRDLDTIIHALHIAARSAVEDAATMRDIAKMLRAGENVPMFAPGEDGARGADRIAEAREDTMEKIEALLERIEEGEDE